MAAPDEKDLTKRQRQVLALIRQGKTPSEIAKRLKMGVNGVYQHRRRLKERGFDVPANGSPNGRSAQRGPRRKATPAPASTNGRLGVLAESRKVIEERHQKVKNAIEANEQERDQVAAEIAEREERLETLKGEEDALKRGDMALQGAEEAILV